MVLLFCACVILFVADFVSNNREHSISTITLIGGIIIFVLPTLVGLIVYSGNFNYSFDEAISRLVLSLLFSALFIRRMGQASDLSALSILAISILVISLIFAWLQANDFIIAPRHGNRMSGVFGNPNYWAGFATIFTPIIIANAILIWGKDGAPTKKYTFYLIGFLSILMTFYYTETRTAIAVSLLTSMLVLVLYFLYLSSIDKILVTRYSGIAIGSMAFIILMIAVLKPSFIPERYLSIFEMSSWYSRLVPWQMAINAFIDSPIFGYGSGSFLNLSYLFQSPNHRLFWELQTYNHAHSEILEILTEGGIIGLAIQLIFYIWLLKSLLNLVVDSSQNYQLRIFCIGIVGSISAYILIGLFSVAPRQISVQLPYLMILSAGIWILANHHKPTINLYAKWTNRIVKSKSWNAFLVFALLILVFTISLEKYGDKSRYMHVRLANDDNNEQLILDLQKEIDSGNEFIFAMDYLVSQQINNGYHLQALPVINKMDQTINNFGNSSLRKAQIFSLENDPDKMAIYLNQAFEADLYNDKLLGMMVKLGLETKDAKMFQKALTNSVKKMVFRETSTLRPDDLEVKYRSQEDDMIFEKTDSTINVFVASSIVNDIINQITPLPLSVSSRINLSDTFRPLAGKAKFINQKSNP
ncbi:MAG: O-antigen ligase family protein [Cyclobacteriaceae bacterium]